MIRGNVRIRSGVLVIGAALVAIISSMSEATAIDAGSGTVVLRGADSQPEASVPIASGGPVVLRGSPPKPAPERSACSQGYSDDPNQGCPAPEDAYTPDYGYWPPYGLGWPYFDLRHRQPRRGFSHHRFPVRAIRSARHLGGGFGRGASHRSGFAHR
jgi:hypothetical protein